MLCRQDDDSVVKSALTFSVRRLILVMKDVSAFLAVLLKCQMLWGGRGGLVVINLRREIKHF